MTFPCLMRRSCVTCWLPDRPQTWTAVGEPLEIQNQLESRTDLEFARSQPVLVGIWERAALPQKAAIARETVQVIVNDRF